MGRFAGWVLMAVMAGGGVAQAGQRHQNWSSVRKLAPGKLIEVKRQGQAGAEECRLVSADDASLTCKREPNPETDWAPGDNARVVFPRGAVQDVWVMVAGEAWGARSWVKLGFGVVLTGLAVTCAVVDPLCVLPIAGVAMAVMAPTPFAMPGPPWSMPRPPRVMPMHRRLVYRSATP